MFVVVWIIVFKLLVVFWEWNFWENWIVVLSSIIVDMIIVFCILFVKKESVLRVNKMKINGFLNVDRNWMYYGVILLWVILFGLYKESLWDVFCLDNLFCVVFKSFNVEFIFCVVIFINNLLFVFMLFCL